jgi:hypothetical protein
MIHTARLYPPAAGHGRYAVEFDGDLIVEGSRDPECDLARALLSKGPHWQGHHVGREDRQGPHRNRH